jgi:arsenate reductase (thioredoxin)
MRATNGDRFEVLSAGTEPKGVNPLAVEAMREIGIDISGHRSKSVTEYLGQPMQYVVTVCDSAKQKCPIFPGTYKFMSWGLEDPAEATGPHDSRLAVFRRIRDEIAVRIKQEFPVHA